MNTNSNTYTIIYTTLIVVIVAAVLGFAALKLKPMQTANVKAETLSQMMSAAQLGDKQELSKLGNDAVLQKYVDNIKEAYTIGLDGQKVADLGITLDNIQLIDNLKPQDVAIKQDGAATLPIYVFKGDISVIPVYGAGLWGPIWGYIAIEPDGQTIAGAYFDHSSETPGLGAKIKDEPWFREKFKGKKIHFGSEPLFVIAKNAEAEEGDDAIDAITGATMTSKGLNNALNVWFKAYETHFTSKTNNGEE